MLRVIAEHKPLGLVSSISIVGQLFCCRLCAHLRFADCADRVRKNLLRHFRRSSGVRVSLARHALFALTGGVCCHVRNHSALVALLPGVYAALSGRRSTLSLERSSILAFLRHLAIRPYTSSNRSTTQYIYPLFYNKSKVFFNKLKKLIILKR